MKKIQRQSDLFDEFHEISSTNPQFSTNISNENSQISPFIDTSPATNDYPSFPSTSRNSIVHDSTNPTTVDPTPDHSPILAQELENVSSNEIKCKKKYVESFSGNLILFNFSQYTDRSGIHFRVSDEQREAICHYALAHPKATQNIIAKKFDLDRSTISKILAKSDYWLNKRFNSDFTVPR